MLFIAEYDFTWENLEPVIARRIEWDTAQPEGFRLVGEYVWQDRDPPFRGIAVIEADSVEALNAFVLHYGPTMRVSIHAASDVVSSIAALGHDPQRSRQGPRRRHRPGRR
ncbi:hypothetical protein L6Q96_00885 [Candidatus Binatia bacterium]|nr:hypothetical protein [Candidatus Binatia bacterium]